MFIEQNRVFIEKSSRWTAQCLIWQRVQPQPTIWVMKTQHASLLTLTVVTAAFLLTGCGIPSVHPLYEPEDLIQHEALPGVWENEEGNRFEVVEFMTLADTSESGQIERVDMNITLTDESLEWFRTMHLEGLYVVKPLPDGEKNLEDSEERTYFMGLIRLGDHYFMDFYLDMSDDNPFRFPVHIFRKVEIDSARMVMHEFDEGYLRDLIENRQVRIQHEVSFDNFLLTAPPSELKKFVRKYSGESEAYRSDTDTYTRVQ